MKHLLFIFILILSACAGESDDRAKPTSLNDAMEQDLANKEREGLLSGRIVDTVFLDFRLGMSGDQVINHLQNLVSAGKVETDAGRYAYAFEGRIGEKYKGYIVPEYYKGGLEDLTLLFDNNQPILPYSDLKDLLEKKYGSPAYLGKPVPAMDFHRAVWIKDNLKVCLQTAPGNVMLSYIDLRKEKDKLRADSLEKAQKVERTKQDL